MLAIERGRLVDLAYGMNQLAVWLAERCSLKLLITQTVEKPRKWSLTDLASHSYIDTLSAIVT